MNTVIIAVMALNVRCPYLLSLKTSVTWSGCTRRVHISQLRCLNFKPLWSSQIPPSDRREWKAKDVSERAKAIHLPSFWTLLTGSAEIPATDHKQPSFSRRQTRNLSHGECSVVFGRYLLTSRRGFDSQFFLALTNCTREEKHLWLRVNEHLLIISEDMRTPWLKCQSARTPVRWPD